VVTLQGSAAVVLAREFQPRAVLLDLTLPDIEGWAVLDQLKRDADTRHIPVHILSGKDAHDRALRQGAFRTWSSQSRVSA
jgi:CheY-like chemotaxis protein